MEMTLTVACLSLFGIVGGLPGIPGRYAERHSGTRKRRGEAA